MRILKQPIIIGYIITGILLGPQFLNLVKSESTITLFSQIGVALLLFIVGLNLSPKVIKEVGKVSLITGLGQICFTFIIGLLISTLLGFDTITSLYISIALTFSSTIIIMKLLSDKNDLEKTYAQISIGFLLVQDIVAILILIIITTLFTNSHLSGMKFLTLFTTLLAVISLVYIIRKITPKLSTFFANSQESLLIFSLAFGLGLASLFQLIGLTLETGALVAGILLSSSPYSHEISARMKPLRDFFLILFFILLGSQMTIIDLTQTIIPALIFSLLILIGNPIIVMTLIGRLGYTKKIGFMAGLTVAQISEFSLILIVLGVKSGHLSKETLSLVTVTSLITFAGSAYMILHSEKLYLILKDYLKIFERQELNNNSIKTKTHNIILFGCDKIGTKLAESLKKIKKPFLIVDYSPKRVEELTKSKLNSMYGDAEDLEFLDEINLHNTKMVISTIPELETNLLLLEKARSKNKKIITVLVAHTLEDANKLYNKGTTYVIMPELLGGSQASLMLHKFGINLNKFLIEKKKHLKELKKLVQSNKPTIR
jgi:Kef-type K+ transport system membrane component KefB